MTWNHRIIRHNSERGAYFAVHEVYYTDGIPDSWTLEPINLLSEEFEDLREEIAMITRALDTPILEIVDEKLIEWKQP